MQKQSKIPAGKRDKYAQRNLDRHMRELDEVCVCERESLSVCVCVCVFVCARARVRECVCRSV